MKTKWQCWSGTDYPGADHIGHGSAQGRTCPHTLLSEWAGAIRPLASQSVDFSESTHKTNVVSRFDRLLFFSAQRLLLASEGQLE